MTAIILVVILAFIAFLNSDSSGVEAIGKILGGIILFIVVGYICIFIMGNPLIIIGAIAVIVFIAVLYSKLNNTKGTLN